MSGLKGLLRGPYRAARGAWRGVRRRLRGPVWERLVRGRRILLRVTTEIEQYRFETYESKEPETLDWLDAELRDGDVFYDVGANIGVYALYAAVLRPGARVFAFEPESLNFAELCRNAHLNRLENLTPCALALSDKLGLELLHVDAMEAGSALNNLGAPSPLSWNGAGSAFRHGVLAAPLDELSARLGLPAPNLLKIDVDGIEPAILRGGEKTLRAPTLRGVLVELCGAWDGAETLGQRRLLESAGLRLAARGPEVPLSTGERARNCIFTRTA